ncbi:MAG: hypothetical protein SGILL_010635, partial [Bacillariaceae sp.]
YYVAAAADDDDDDDDNKGLPLLVINGGPGAAHNYNLPLRPLACGGGGAAGHSAVIYYDQGGNGQSKIPPDANLERDYPFVLDIDYLGGEELQAVIDATILSEDKDAKFHLVSDSFGTMIALQYVLNYHENKDRNKHIESLVLNGPIPNTREFTENAWNPKTGTVGAMPGYFLERYKAIVEKQDFEDNPEFQSMEQTLGTIFTFRSQIPGDCFMDALLGGNHEIYEKIWGVSEFVPMDGTLKPFDVYAALEDFCGDNGGGNLLQLPPTLLTYGEFDEIREESILKLNDLWQKAGGYAKYHMFVGSGHATIGDATAELISKTGDFLKRVESGMISVEDGHHPSDGEYPNNDEPNAGRWIFVVEILVGFLIGNLSGYLIARRSAHQRHHQYEQVNDVA